jgi:DNA-binding Lrp family transcriptional regulator
MTAHNDHSAPHFRVKQELYAVDEIDQAIIDLLLENADQPAKRIADRVGLSPSAVERRIAKLKQTGVIARIAAQVDPKALGRGLTVLVELEIQNEHRHTLEAFQDWARKTPEIQACWYVTGDMDYVLQLAVRDLDEYNHFIDRMMREQQGLVRKYKSLIALKVVK